VGPGEPWHATCCSGRQPRSVSQGQQYDNSNNSNSTTSNFNSISHSRNDNNPDRLAATEAPPVTATAIAVLGTAHTIGTVVLLIVLPMAPRPRQEPGLVSGTAPGEGGCTDGCRQPDPNPAAAAAPHVEEEKLRLSGGRSEQAGRSSKQAGERGGRGQRLLLQGSRGKRREHRTQLRASSTQGCRRSPRVPSRRGRRMGGTAGRLGCPSGF